jgi:NAD(P)-dependent dehydrogenase (short-subunit alcohol dehydrogenase family)
MTARLDGKVAVITGGSSGMGRATTLRFLDEGASVVFGDLNENTAKETLDLASDAGKEKNVRFVRTDVAEESDVAAMIDLAVTEFGRLDVVFNNAGLGGAFGPLTEIEVEDWDYTFAVLTRGPFLGIKHGARVMIEQGEGGSIISTASVAGLSGGSGPQAYSAAKAALINLTMAAAVEFGKHKIRVNAICPGGINTPLVQLGGQRTPEEVAKGLELLQPIPIAGRPEHIAAAALFLASDDSLFVSGHALVVDGGLEAAGPNLWRRGGRQSVFDGIRGVSRGTTGQDHTIRGSASPA